MKVADYISRGTLECEWVKIEGGNLLFVRGRGGGGGGGGGGGERVRLFV